MRASRPFVRIIGGKWRGRRLPVPLTASFRPSGDRIREALFNCLGGRLDGRICLDLFAGTGALGLEAASRGAAKVVFVERDARSLARTAEVANILNADNRAEFSAVRADIFAWLASGGGGKDLIPRAGAPAPACVSGRSSARMRDGGEDGGVERFDLIFADPPFADYRRDSSWEKLLSAVGPRLAPGGRVYCESDRFFPLPPGWLEEKARRAGRAHWRILRRMEGVGEEGME